ncbi:unnamed protein product [Spirodela intermedia]|uniref:Choline transporter-like protein n=1 Tax=Spirodela intermedia TaxID=51605 RepID=A0A7I8I8T9_SPIIN|nr:unnamed protein product [Spirodela intermedia]CAA6654059.1 unnamed protein product [Spirodela intermedia]
MGATAEDGRPDGGGPTEMGEEEVVVVAVDSSPLTKARVSKLQVSHPVSSLQVAPQGLPAQARSMAPSFQPTPNLVPLSLSISLFLAMTPTSGASLNSRRYTNRISLFLFLLHLLAAGAAISFFIFKAVMGIRHVLSFWLPPVEGAAVLSILLAFAWQKAVRAYPTLLTVRLIVWSSAAATLAAGILLLCFSMPTTDGAGLVLIIFSVGVGLYACWVTRRMPFAALPHAQPAVVRDDARGAVWITLWCFAVIGALNFYYPPLTILALILSLMWTAEVMRNVANLTMSRAVALYYLRGMQSDVSYCFQRAATVNLGGACLGSLFVPAIEFCRIIARALNLLEGEDEFLFSCAHCCLHVMEAVFRYGNSWAYVHIAAYGSGFVEASQSTWGLFERSRMEALVDADITSAICFLTGVASGSLCVIFAASWTYSGHRHYTATVSLLAFFVGYLMTRIGMALPQACVGCYYVCYAENPTSRFFLNDSTIADRLDQIRNGREATGFTPRLPRRYTPSV